MKDIQTNEVAELLKNSPLVGGSKKWVVTKLPNKYGLNPNIFYASNGKKEYFIKYINHPGKLTNTDNRLEKYLNLPTRELTLEKQGYTVEVSSYIKGTLFTDVFLKDEYKNNDITHINLEDRKNKYLRNLYNQTKGVVRYAEVDSCITNKLYKNRFLGDRYSEYYRNMLFQNIFDRNIVLNGRGYPSINTVVEKIRNKYEKINGNKDVTIVLGHGDAHHQNIILEETTSKIYFIDCEYSSFIPMSMELAKPYYIDLFGTLFFFYNDVLLKYFDVRKCEIIDDKVNLRIILKELPKLRLQLVQNKISNFSDLMADDTDQLNLNDYLIINHMLSRNPNQYNAKVLPVFLSLVPLLNDFNVMKPEELFSAYQQEL